MKRTWQFAGFDNLSAHKRGRLAACPEFKEEYIKTEPSWWDCPRCHTISPSIGTPPKKCHKCNYPDKKK